MSTMNFKEFFWAFTFPKQKIKIRRQSFNSPWMTKGLGKSSKKKRRLYKQFLKNSNPEKVLYLGLCFFYFRKRREQLD